MDSVSNVLHQLQRRLSQICLLADAFLITTCVFKWCYIWINLKAKCPKI